MIHRHTIGKIPPKPHTTLYHEGKLMMEQCLTRDGFEGAYSILYYKIPPTDENAVEALRLEGFCPFEVISEQLLYRRHLRSQDIKHHGDFLTGRKTLLVNKDLQIGVIKPLSPPEKFFSNADGDELYFVHEGSGSLESLYGLLPFREHDYILIPKSTPYRLHFDGHKGTALVFEGRPKIGIPGEYRNSWGQLTMYAPYSHRDFKAPEELLVFDEKKHGKPPYPLVVKHSDMLSVHMFKHFPHELVGWDGSVYPVTFNIHDYQPKTGLVHLPPTIHTTFSGRNFVVCSFVPRLVDYHKDSIPCPYGHSNVDMDEILYYVKGNFTSRKGIDCESISLHPKGIPHGPHPGAYERSIGTKHTEELAVMCDAWDALQLTTVAVNFEDPNYHRTWIEHFIS